MATIPVQPLADLAVLIRILFRRLMAIEYRTGASEPFSFADVEVRLDRVTHHRGIYGKSSSPPPDASPEFVRRLEGLERQSREALGRLERLEARRNPASLAPCNAARVAHANALRKAISDIIEDEPEATGPAVLERLRQTHAGKLPGERTVRYHLNALRGNGNAQSLPPGSNSASRP
jgi:hypothetical protein